ncbi:NPCBM/NEW2 domain-containing protein [Fibrobacter sp. UWR2]|uniref:NPCBM/NEW2 domain-containing protein n=1 Tax=Fibrobacter sp. UWR2 TaxID=1964352 RepID=UPI000B526C5D|nr:NPCBM/NEW2 domain-containing protein [Fibrobacter sp. UWR2]OWV00188.1 glycosyl hydrolase family 98 [Fibrobacter sp. UWR2]
MSNTKKEKTDIVENKVERKSLAESLREWVDSLHLGKPQAVMAAVSVVVMLAAFLIFNNLSVSYARRWDIDWGYYSILSTFILLIAGIIVNLPFVAKNVKGFLPSGKSFCGLALLMIFFSVFMFGNISNTHRVLSDETSWESMGLQMYFQHTGGICNEGVWTDGVLDCKTEVNNFKGKALGFVYSLVFNFMEPDRDTALLVNYPFYILSLLAFFLALSKWFKSSKLALAATAFLGGMPIYLLQARSASTEVLYICLLTFLMAWYAFVPTNKVTWKHFLLTVPLLGFFAQTRQETVFAFIPFALYYYRYFLEKPYRLPAFIASVIAVSWPSVNNMAAYRGYDFQGGEHAAHSFENLWFNLKTNIETMLNLDTDPTFGGIMMNPFYTTFTIILLASTVWLLVRMLVFRRYIRGFILGIFFCLQIFVIMFNVSGTFTIDINQRYVLVALPMFALLMALGLYDAFEFTGSRLFKSKIREDAAASIVMGLACLLTLGLMVYHAPSYRNNMLYYKNKLLGEEEFLNNELAGYPANSVFIYSRPWQMLAQGHSAFSERTFEGWSTDVFADWMQKSGGNIYLVRGQDGYGKVNRDSRVVGFKTTDQIDKILDSYKHERMLVDAKKFGYPLVIYKILSKKGVSQYAQNFTVSEQKEGTIILNKRFPETIACEYTLNDEKQGDAIVTVDADTLRLDSQKIRNGMNRAVFTCSMPDGDTAVIYRDFFMDSDRAILLSTLKIDRFSQDWGDPQLNESVEHHRLTLDGEPFRYGIGSHANSSLEYTLLRGFDMFHAVVGLDDESACGDGAYFVVNGDGRELARSKKLYSMEKQKLDVDIKGVNHLNLKIEMGDNKDCDHGDWANAWLEAR